MIRYLIPPVAGIVLATASHAQDVASICFSSVRPGEGTFAEIHYPDGRMTTVNTYAAPGLTIVLRQQFDTPLTEAMQDLARPVLAAAPEAVPCADAPAATLVVRFTDGSRERRDATCRGNAIEAFVFALVTSVPPRGQALASEQERHASILDGATDACGHDWPDHG